MDVCRFVAELHLREGRPVGELAAAYGVHRSAVYKRLARYRREGEAGLALRSRRPRTSPGRVVDRFEDEIVALRKELSDEGFDAGAVTIHYHLVRRHSVPVPSVSSIWRVLRARGFVTPQPKKRPKGSYRRFSAELPNERWQADVTHVGLASGETVEVLNVIDDHSRLCVASRVFQTTRSADVVRTLHRAGDSFGYPESILTDNGAIFTSSFLGGQAAMEADMLSLGVEVHHSRPYHPQTCGKVERFHQTLKRYLAAQDPAETQRQLQAQLDRFSTYYNEVRPHRAIGRQTPREAFEARGKAGPKGAKIDVSGYRVRHDKVGRGGTITIRHRAKLHHIGIGRPYAGWRVVVLIAGLEVRVLTVDGNLIRRVKLDPKTNYQRQP